MIQSKGQFIECTSLSDLKGLKKTDGLYMGKLGYVKGRGWFECVAVDMSGSKWKPQQVSTVITGDAPEDISLIDLENNGDIARVEVVVVGRRTDIIGDTHAQKLEGFFKNTGGVVALEGALTASGVLGVGNSTLAVSGTEVVCQVTGVAAADIQWELCVHIACNQS